MADNIENVYKVKVVDESEYYELNTAIYRMKVFDSVVDAKVDIEEAEMIYSRFNVK